MLSPFDRVDVNLTISVPPAQDLSVHNTAMVTYSPLPNDALYKAYYDVKTFITDFPVATYPEDNSWGSTFYSNNTSGVLIVIHCTKPSADTDVTVSTAILQTLDELEASVTPGTPSSFYTVSFANADDLFYSDLQVVSELEALEASGKELFVMGQSYSPSMFQDLATWPVSAYLQSTALKSLGVCIIGYPNLTEDTIVPKVSAGASAFASQISLTNGAQQDLDGQTFFDVKPLKINSVDKFNITYNKANIIQYVNDQINMYFRYKNQTQFCFGLAMATENIPVMYYYTRQLLKEELIATLSPIFFSGTLHYNHSTIARGRALIDSVLAQFVTAQLIDTGYTIVDPTLDFTMPIPRSLKWMIYVTLAGRVYAISIGGNLQG
jgi:hypothetical protein